MFQHPIFRTFVFINIVGCSFILSIHTPPPSRALAALQAGPGRGTTGGRSPTAATTRLRPLRSRQDMLRSFHSLSIRGSLPWLLRLPKPIRDTPCLHQQNRAHWGQGSSFQSSVPSPQSLALAFLLHHQGHRGRMNRRSRNSVDGDAIGPSGCASLGRAPRGFAGRCAAHAEGSAD